MEFWRLNALYFDSCETVLDNAPDSSVDLFLQDTPFGVTQNAWDIKPNLPVMWEKWLRVGKPAAPFIFFATMRFAAELIASMPKLFRYDLVWNKVGKATGFLNAQDMPLRSHELILVFYRQLPTYNPQKYIGRPNHSRGGRHARGEAQTNNNYGKFNNVPAGPPTNDKYPLSILDFGVVHPPLHPTQKPLELIRHLILTYSNPGDTVFDGYAGSGTTAEACIIEGRNFVTAETEDEYYKIASKRITARQQQKTLL